MATYCAADFTETSTEALVEKVHELERGLAELALKELAAHREDVYHREEEVERRGRELEKKARELRAWEADLKEREEAIRRLYGKEAALSGISMESPSILESGNIKALMTPTPTRSAVTLSATGQMPINFAGEDERRAPLPMIDALPTMPMMLMPPTVLGSGPPAPEAAPETSLEEQDIPECQAEPSPARMRAPRPSLPDEGSASRLKAIFEQRASIGGGGIRPAASRAGGNSEAGRGGRSSVGSNGSGGGQAQRCARWTVPGPVVAAVAVAAAPVGQMPPPKVSLQELLAKEEAATSSDGFASLAEVAAGIAAVSMGGRPEQVAASRRTSTSTNDPASGPEEMPSSTSADAGAAFVAAKGGSAALPRGLVSPSVAGATLGKVPAPKIALADLLRQDEEKRSSRGGALYE